MILQGDKDSSVIITDKSDKMQKLENMIKERINKGTYEWTDGTTFQDLKRFQDFLYKKVYNDENYNKMYPHSNYMRLLRLTSLKIVGK